MPPIWENAVLSFRFSFRSSTVLEHRCLFYSQLKMITRIILKLFFSATDVCVIGKLIPRDFLCVIGIHRIGRWRTTPDLKASKAIYLYFGHLFPCTPGLFSL